MYQSLLFLHSLTRWLVLLAMGISIYRAYRAYTSGTAFTGTEDMVRHWTATIAHLQLIIGITLYVQSPIVSYFWGHLSEAIHDMDNTFFGIIHILLMLTAIVLVTIGSALAKRRRTDKEKFRTVLLWYSTALFIILIAIPWPFSPLAARPYYR